jgi:hypothetical protein
VGEGIGHQNTEPLATTLTVLSIRVNQQPTARGSVEWPPERGRNSKRVRKNWVIDASSGVNNLVSGSPDDRQGAGSSGTGTGVEGQKCRQLGLAGLVFTEVMQREEQRSDRVELLAAKGAHASPQPG